STPAPLLLAPTSLNFGSITVGQSGDLSVTATNTSSSPITFGALTATGPYTVSNGTCPDAGATLASGAQCTLDVTFAPASSGTQTGILSVANSATELPLTVILAGVGTTSGTQQQPGAFTFAVNGSSSASLTVTSGQPAAFTLTATATNGFSGPIAITCSPMDSALYASCSLLASTL